MAIGRPSLRGRVGGKKKFGGKGGLLSKCLKLQFVVKNFVKLYLFRYSFVLFFVVL